MHISSSRIQNPVQLNLTHKAPAPSSHSEDTSPQDQFTFGSSLSGDARAGIRGGALGVVPFVGIVANFGMGQGSTRPSIKAAGNLGGFSNLAGTATTAVGLLTGNDTATTVGLSLLGVSGLTGAYVGYAV